VKGKKSSRASHLPVAPSLFSVRLLFLTLASSMSVMEVDSEDVVRLMLQYMKEHNLTATLKQLQAESKVCLDTVDNLDNLSSDINHGRWEAVIPQVCVFSITPKNASSAVALYLFNCAMLLPHRCLAWRCRLVSSWPCMSRLVHQIMCILSCMTEVAVVSSFCQP
jgi:LisH-like dimerisation domain